MKDETLLKLIIAGTVILLSIFALEIGNLNDKTENLENEINALEIDIDGLIYNTQEV